MTRVREIFSPQRTPADPRECSKLEHVAIGLFVQEQTARACPASFGLDRVSALLAPVLVWLIISRSLVAYLVQTDPRQLCR